MSAIVLEIMSRAMFSFAEPGRRGLERGCGRSGRSGLSQSPVVAGGDVAAVDAVAAVGAGEGDGVSVICSAIAKTGVEEDENGSLTGSSWENA